MTKKRDPEVLAAETITRGQPSKYEARFCAMLLNHNRQGGSFESFAAVCGVAIRTIYGWLKDHPDFLQAKEEGEPFLYKFYEDMGKMLATGQLRRVKSEEPVIVDGKPALDPKTGDVLMRREYEEVTGSAPAWKHLTKNLVGWTDKRLIAFASMPDDGRRAKDLTPPERMQEIEEMTKALADLAIAEANAGTDVAG